MEECQAKLTQDKRKKPVKNPKMLQFCATVNLPICKNVIYFLMSLMMVSESKDRFRFQLQAQWQLIHLNQ